MSRGLIRIQATLDVVQEVRKGFQNEPGGPSVKNLRIQAVKSVAAQRDILPSSVSNKFRRELRPDIDGIPEFDRLLEDWLVSGSDKLAYVLRQHTSDSGDLERIETIFNGTSEPDLLLAHEFGYDASDRSFKEGKVQLHLHLTKERSRSLVLSAKAIWNQEQDGQVCCSICGFSFGQSYGKVGEGFIEAHHTKAISSMEPNTRVTVDDLVPVCSNCHSIIHHQRPWLTVDELRRIVLSQGDLGPP